MPSSGGALWAASAGDEVRPDIETVYRDMAVPYQGAGKENAVFTRISILFNPIHLDSMKKAMNVIGITGMTVKNAMGCGMQKGRTDYYRGVRVKTLDLLPKLQMDIVVTAVPFERVIAAAQKVLHTGKIGDGKIFVSTVDNVVKISTGERGYAALQDMAS
jgi:Amt family ammonium transporter